MQRSIQFNDILAEFGNELNIFKNKKPAEEDFRPAKKRSKSDIFSNLDQRLLKLYKAIDMAG